MCISFWILCCTEKAAEDGSLVLRRKKVSEREYSIPSCLCRDKGIHFILSLGYDF